MGIHNQYPSPLLHLCATFQELTKNNISPIYWEKQTDPINNERFELENDIVLEAHELRRYMFY